MENVENELNAVSMPWKIRSPFGVVPSRNSESFWGHNNSEGHSRGKTLKNVVSTRWQKVQQGDEKEIKVKLMDHRSKDGSPGAGDKLWIGKTEVWNVHLSDINHNWNI